MRTVASVLLSATLLTLASGCADRQAEPPPPVVVSFDDGWGQIFVADADGSGLRQVTPTVGYDASGMPDANYANFSTLSPDGSMLAYTRSGRLIETVDLASGESKTVHEGGYQPAFSPDGKTIAFTSGGSIHVMNVDGSDERTVAQQDSAFGPEYSPDGTRVMFNVGGYIVQVPASGGEPTVVLRDQFWNADPTLSPDGSTMVFSSNRGGNNGSELYSMPAAGGPITALTETYAVHPQFTPDGSRILYTRATTRNGDPVIDSALSERSELASMNPDGTDQRRLTPRSITASDPSVGGGR